MVEVIPTKTGAQKQKFEYTVSQESLYAEKKVIFQVSVEAGKKIVKICSGAFQKALFKVHKSAYLFLWVLKKKWGVQGGRKNIHFSD